jgi:sortase A
MRVRRFVGASLVVAGLALCAAAALHYLRGSLAQRQALREWEGRAVSPTTLPAAALATTPRENPGIVSSTPLPRAPSYPYGQPIARIKIPAAKIDWVVFGGCDQASLEKGPGHVPGTALPGAVGPPYNCVITGHRDSHFRHLGWLRLGHRIELETPSGEKTYTITGRRIVNPDEVSVLAPTQSPRLTLITCYPFDYIGPAPKRLVLIAEPVSSVPDRHHS